MIEWLKDRFHWHILGRCRKHGRKLDIVPILFEFSPSGYNEERFACVECEPNMARYVPAEA